MNLDLSLISAFVLKNYFPLKYKVVLLHKTLGKISCIYTRKDAAARLCTGSLIHCVVEQKKKWYEFVNIDIHFVPMNCSLEELTFFHEIVLLCLKQLPQGVIVGELFDFLSYVYQRTDQLTAIGRSVVLLRIFLMFDLLPEDKVAYRCALQDPYDNVENFDQNIVDLVKVCWRRFYQENSM